MPYVSTTVQEAAGGIIAALEETTAAIQSLNVALVDMHGVLESLEALLTVRLPSALASGKLKVTIL